MNRLRHLSIVRAFCVLTFTCLAVLWAPATADEPEQTTPYPGFRPDSDYAQAFLDSLDTATIAVLPSIVRRAERCAHSFVAQELIIEQLNEMGIVSAIARPKRISMGPVKRPSQWEMFQYGMDRVAESITGYETGTDYVLVMEFLVPDYSSVFGIELYILDTQGRNAFSFLLNSHHQMFVDAKLYAKNSTEAARTKMIEKAAIVGVAALQAQIELASKGQS